MGRRRYRRPRPTSTIARLDFPSAIRYELRLLMRDSREAGYGSRLVSVIIPTYNRGSLLPAVLDSVFSQTECPPFEVVVVDDGSTDDTTDVLQRFAHPLRVVRHERNRGLATSRQTGATHARGRLL